MKKLKGLLVAFVAAFIVLGSWTMVFSEMKTHVVKKGETLWGIAHQNWGSGMLWTKIAEENKISDPKKLQIGKNLNIPSVEKIQVKNHNTSPYGAVAKKGNPKVLEAIDQTFYTDSEKTEFKKVILESDPERITIKKGDKADCVSDKDGVYCNDDGYQFEWNKVSELSAYRWNVKLETKECNIDVVDICGNFVSECETKPIEKTEEPQEETKIKLTVPKVPKFLKVPKIFVPTVFEKIACRDYELTVWSGLWYGSKDRARGRFAGIEAMAWNSCWNWGEGIGFYGSISDGNLKEGYHWEEWRFGPQFGLRYLDYYEKADGTILPWGIQNKIRLVGGATKGANNRTDYSMKEYHVFVGPYVEAVAQLNQEIIVGFTAEGWIDIYRTIDSSWSGDLGSNQSSIRFGPFIQIELIKDVLQSRSGISGFWQQWDKQFGIGIFSELRFYETIMAGLYASTTFEDGFVWGPNARWEMWSMVRRIQNSSENDKIFLTERCSDCETIKAYVFH
ncbi:MAG: hypothetical protein COU40_01300 [Candidatus Moranbacteria bacterium CG10_big_fil_rev_8_21_14_0_10_35_21]|nr:MAG: hypothetical protein COU40_01300 [Candidatus Moranbacteria bacterium CG10_big_fil_rev_8_21_14_0_10_35_21]PJA88390.1 MAG: hypothetical protein CO139_03355 [Candidatus Moranbacteria bacterium CG_4_9_14_3_um_filter_36_9]